LQKQFVEVRTVSKNSSNSHPRQH